MREEKKKCWPGLFEDSCSAFFGTALWSEKEHYQWIQKLRLLSWLCNWVNMGPPAHLLSASFYETDGPALWVLATLINCIMIYGFYKNCISLLCKHVEYHARQKECLQTFMLKYLTGISPWSLFHDTEFRRSPNAWVIMEVNSRLTVSSQAIPPPFLL